MGGRWGYRELVFLLKDGRQLLGPQDKRMECWIRILGLPTHLWTRGLLMAIGSLCGGLVRWDSTVEAETSTRGMRILVKWGSLHKIPRFVLIFCCGKSNHPPLAGGVGRAFSGGYNDKGDSGGE